MADDFLSPQPLLHASILCWNDRYHECDKVSKVNCQVLYIFNALTANFSVGLASINLCIRTIAVWRSDTYVVVSLIILILGHWALLLRTAVLVKADWIDGQGCVDTGNDIKILIALFTYSMIFDFIVMVLTGIKLRFGFLQKTQSRLVKMLYTDGLMYFAIVFTVDLVALVCTGLNLSPIMSIIGDIPLGTFATIAACRVVRRLNAFVNSKGVDIYMSRTENRTSHLTSIEFANGTVAFADGANSQGTRIRMDVVSTTHYDDLDGVPSLGEDKAATNV